MFTFKEGLEARPKQCFFSRKAYGPDQNNAYFNGRPMGPTKVLFLLWKAIGPDQIYIFTNVNNGRPLGPTKLTFTGLYCLMEGHVTRPELSLQFVLFLEQF